MKKLASLALTGLFLSLTLATAPAHGADPQRLTVPLSDPGKPVTLSASLLHGSIRVERHDGRDIEVEIFGRQESKKAEEERGGMKRIPNSSLGMKIEEQNNVVSVHGNWASRVSQLVIRVPRNTSAHISCTNSGNVYVGGLTGEHELSNTNGDITAENVSGSLLAHTTNGDVRVTFDDYDGDADMSFATFNGDVDVTFPGGLDANVRISTVRGDIFTDFDFRVEESKPKVRTESEGKVRTVLIDDDVRAVIGRGGQKLHFKTWNGSVYIRSGKR